MQESSLQCFWINKAQFWPVLCSLEPAAPLPWVLAWSGQGAAVVLGSAGGLSWQQHLEGTNTHFPLPVLT